MGFSTDTYQLYVGDGAANHEIAKLSVAEAAILGIAPYVIATGETVTIDTDEQLNIVEEYQIDGTGTLKIDGNGLLNVSDGPNTGERDTVFTVVDETKLDGIETGATIDQTGAEIKSLYEAEVDTNAYNDAAVTKLAGIETGANVNNISDVNATDLTDGGNTTLHDHDGISENTAARHIQGTDTTLGTMTGDVNMGTHKLTNLSVPSATGQSVRATVTITETALEDAVTKKHTESHNIASHSDTTATGANLNELVGSGDTDLHKHDGRYYSESEVDTISGTLQTDIDTCAVSGGTEHDGFSDYVGNEHVDHSGVTITAGTGLTGGGDITTNRTLDVDVGITNDKIVQMDDLDAVSGDFVKLTASGIEGRSFSEVMGDLSAQACSDFSMNTHKITSATDPLAAQDVATKNYVDSNTNISDAAYNETTWSGVTGTGASKNTIRNLVEDFFVSSSGIVNTTFELPSVASLPDVDYTHKEIMRWEGCEAKFGKWRQYFNAAEHGWTLVYNTAIDPYTIWPPAYAGRDSGNSCANICAYVRLNVAEGDSGRNLFEINFAKGGAADSTPDFNDGAWYYFFDGSTSNPTPAEMVIRGAGNMDAVLKLIAHETVAAHRINLRADGNNNKFYIEEVTAMNSDNTDQTRIQFVTIDTPTGRFGIGVNPTNANGGILQLKEGITFPATAVAASDVNTLDDYKEGEATVGLSCGTSGSITLNGSYEKLGYTKIGRQVTIVGSILVSSVSSPVGALTLTGLPYTAGNAYTKAGAVAIYATGLEATAYDVVMGHVVKNTTTLKLSTYYNGTVYGMAGDIKAGSDIYICGTYFV